MVVVGDAGCGKTSLLNVFSTNRRIDEHTPSYLKMKLLMLWSMEKEYQSLFGIHQVRSLESWPGFNTGHV